MYIAIFSRIFRPLLGELVSWDPGQDSDEEMTPRAGQSSMDPEDWKGKVGTRWVGPYQALPWSWNPRVINT